MDHPGFRSYGNHIPDFEGFIGNQKKAADDVTQAFLRSNTDRNTNYPGCAQQGRQLYSEFTQYKKGDEYQPPYSIVL